MFALDRANPAPTIPPYPNVEGQASYPDRWMMALLDEDFGGFTTTDTHATVQTYYWEHLAQEG